MNKNLEQLLNVIKQQTENPTIVTNSDGQTFNFCYEITSLTTNDYKSDDHTTVQITLCSPIWAMHGPSFDEMYEQIEKHDQLFLPQLQPNVLLKQYGPWYKPYDDKSSPTMYITSSQDTFLINLTDHHIIITIILSGMY